METPHTAAGRGMAPPSSNHSHLSLGAHVSPPVIDSPPAHAAADQRGGGDWSDAASESWSCSDAGDMPASQERLAVLAAAQASLDAARAEIGKLTAIMEEALDEDEVAEALKGMRAAPAEYIASRRPVYRKTAAAIEDERRAASQVAEIEQQIRDNCMSPADMLVEVRSLLRKQNAGFEAMRAENDLLQSRVTELEAVVSAIILLPQLSQRPSDFELTTSERLHDAAQGGPTTLLHLAAQKQLHDVAEYALRIGQTPRAQDKIILLNPPEECRAPCPLEATPSPHSPSAACLKITRYVVRTRRLIPAADCSRPVVCGRQGGVGLVQAHWERRASLLAPDRRRAKGARDGMEDHLRRNT